MILDAMNSYIVKIFGIDTWTKLHIPELGSHVKYIYM